MAKDKDGKFFESLLPEEGKSICKQENCNHKTVKFSAMCAKHHFEMVKNKQCPWNVSKDGTKVIIDEVSALEVLSKEPKDKTICKYICLDCKHVGWTSIHKGCRKCKSHNLITEEKRRYPEVPTLEVVSKEPMDKTICKYICLDCKHIG